MSETTCIYFSATFTSRESMAMKDSKIFTEKAVLYNGRFVKGIDYHKECEVGKAIHEFFKLLTESVGANEDTCEVRNIKRMSNDDELYRFNLVVYDSGMNEFIQKQIETQLDPFFDNRPRLIDAFLQRFLDDEPLGKYNFGYSIENDKNFHKIYGYCYSIGCSTPKVSKSDIILYKAKNKNADRILQAFGKLYMDSECLRITTNKLLCDNEYKIIGSSAEYSSNDSIHITLPEGIEEGFITYLKILIHDDSIQSIIDQTISYIESTENEGVEEFHRSWTFD